MVLAASTAVGASAGECALSTLKPDMLWSGEVADWRQARRGAIFQFGEQNLQHDAAGLRVAYPKGSYDPAAVRTAGAPLGGAQFRTPFDRMNVSVGDSVGIRYRLTLDDNFQFVRGGKLPGLYGGRANTGGKVPNGTDGFSVRFGWQTEGLGALLAYLPTSAKWGTVFGLGHWRLVPGRTIELAVFVRLNTPGLHDGVVAAWADDALVVYAPDVVFRTATALRIDGFYFSTFFGGSTPDWATPVDTSATYGRLDVFRMDARALEHCADTRPGLGGRKEIN
jgi:hypothetical protein